MPEISAARRGSRAYICVATWNDIVMQSSDIPEQVRDAAARLAPSPVLAIEELRKGANSRVFRVKAAVPSSR